MPEEWEGTASVLKANLTGTCRGNDHLPAPPLPREMDLEMNPEEKGTETQDIPTMKGFRPPGPASSFSKGETGIQREKLSCSRFHQS